MYKKYIKRILDIIFSLAAIIALFPLILLLAIAIKINMGSPVIFNQMRVGKNEKIFMMHKFRTMTSEKGTDGKLLPDNQRVTRLGKFLRGSSLDELPELVNILAGDISIIGPRPLLVEYIPYYTEYEKQRHNVRGGLTVPEVLYENVTPTWEEQFRYEVEYANNVSFALDLKILFKTLYSVLKRKKAGYGDYVRKSLIEERNNNIA